MKKIMLVLALCFIAGFIPVMAQTHSYIVVNSTAQYTNYISSNSFGLSLWGGIFRLQNMYIVNPTTHTLGFNFYVHTATGGIAGVVPSTIFERIVNAGSILFVDGAGISLSDFSVKLSTNVGTELQNEIPFLGVHRPTIDYNYSK